MGQHQTIFRLIGGMSKLTGSSARGWGWAPGPHLYFHFLNLFLWMQASFFNRQYNHKSQTTTKVCMTRRMLARPHLLMKFLPVQAASLLPITARSFAVAAARPPGYIICPLFA